MASIEQASKTIYELLPAGVRDRDPEYWDPFPVDYRTPL
jgi:hypothetical protein